MYSYCYVCWSVYSVFIVLFYVLFVCVYRSTATGCQPTALISQKAAPLTEINVFTSRIILISTTAGSISGLNQTSIREFLTFTSINHTGWILIALTTSDNLWTVYFAIYCWRYVITAGCLLQETGVSTLHFILNRWYAIYAPFVILQTSTP